MKVVNLSAKNSILNKYLAEIRDVNIQKERMRFRQNIIRIGHVEAYEASHYLDYAETEVQTPLDKCNVELPQNNVVIGTVFRAGLPLHQAFLDVFDEADNAFVSAYRYYLDKA